MNQNLRVNKTNFHRKGFALGLVLKQRRKATRKWPILKSAPVFTRGYEYDALKTSLVSTGSMQTRMTCHMNLWWRITPRLSCTLREGRLFSFFLDEFCFRFLHKPSVHWPLVSWLWWAANTAFVIQIAVKSWATQITNLVAMKGLGCNMNGGVWLHPLPSPPLPFPPLPWKIEISQNNVFRSNFICWRLTRVQRCRTNCTCSC